MVTTYDIYRFSQKENRLTAQLMLVLETNRIPLLERFLELCQIDCKGKNLDFMTTELQDVEEESKPDAAVVENNGQKILFIESKLKGKVDPNQLVSHVRSGKGNVPVVCISRGKVEPPEIEEAAVEFMARINQQFHSATAETPQISRFSS